MDLQAPLAVAGAGLLAILDAQHDFLPINGYEVAHDLGRWWDAALRLEEAIAFVIPGELEAAALRHLHRLTDNPDRLLMVRPDLPGLADHPGLADKAKVNPHNFRETLLAFGGLVRRRRSRWAHAAALQLVGSMARILQPDGRLDCTALGAWGLAPATRDPSHQETPRGDWFDGTATSGRAVEALVWLYEATGEAAVLELAGRLAAHHLRLSVRPDGGVRDEIVAADNVGHDHSYLGTLRGLLLFGLLTGQRPYVDAVEATYRHAVRHRIVKESGWAPHDLGKLRFPNHHGDPVADPASAGDAAQLALWLALHARGDDLFDDVERLVRARLLPAQVGEADIRGHPERTFAPRDRGAWCIHGPSHAGKGCTPDVHAAVIHTLCDVHAHILGRTPDGVRVYLHFDAENEWVKTTASRDAAARLRVTVKQPAPILIRIPGWAPEASLRLTVDGEDCAWQRHGAFAWVPPARLRGGSLIEMTHALPERRSEEVMPSGRRYHFAWRGDTIVGATPRDDEREVPFYPPMP